MIKLMRTDNHPGYRALTTVSTQRRTCLHPLTLMKVTFLPHASIFVMERYTPLAHISRLQSSSHPFFWMIALDVGYQSSVAADCQ